jgi:hypothetical protein
MSDEAHFHLSGFVNKQNFRCWSPTNPTELRNRPLHSSKVTVRCAVSTFARHPVTEEAFFQHDGATCHTARDSMAAVRNLFLTHVISRYGDITWPARSPDLPECDFFLWGYLKTEVFKAPAPHTVQE